LGERHFLAVADGACWDLERRDQLFYVHEALQIGYLLDEGRQFLQSGGVEPG
jgi:hypothetical protein